MRIGISVLTKEGLGIWANGLGQNVFHLARLFRALPFVTDVILLNSGDQTAVSADAGATAASFKLIPPREAADLVDVVIEMSGGLDVEWLDLMRARGKRVVFHVCGHPYVALVEPSLFGVDGYFTRADRCDALWVVEQFAPFVPLLRALHRCPAHLVPAIWASDFLDERTKALGPVGLTFGVQDPAAWASNGLRLATFEPNIGVTKTSVIPLMACEEAYRRDPSAVAQVTALNTVHLTGQPTWDYLVASLDLTKADRLKLECRHDFAGFMSQFGDAVVVHQWRNPSNYLYMDTLYGDYPLIHNSPWAREVGYYYPESDVGAAADQILAARGHHGEDLPAYRQRSRRFLAAVDPLHPDNLTAYARQLLALSAGAPWARA
jgi:hypothetical protein